MMGMEKRNARMKDICMVALDLDETTLRSDGTLSERTGTALEAALQAQMEVVVASGRPYGSLPGEILGMPGLRYAVTSNGAAIHRLPSGERLHSFSLEERAVERLLDLLVPEGACLEAYTGGVAHSDAAFVANPQAYGCVSDSSLRYIRATRTAQADMPGYIRGHMGQLDGISIRCRDLEEKQRFAHLIRKHVPEVYLTTSFSHLLEMVSPKAGKGAGVCYLSQRLGIPRERIAAFGNGDNDQDMLDFAGVGVAVANASKACLAAADRITKSNDEDGVALVLEEILRAKREHGL